VMLEGGASAFPFHRLCADQARRARRDGTE
jgi:hypothetical protein